MIRKLLVVAAAVAIPVSVVAVTGVTAGAAKGPSPATDTAVCSGISGTVNFSTPLTTNGSTSATETTTVNATLTGCSATGGVPVSLTGGTVTGSFAGKPGSAKHPSATCGGLLGATKEKGTVSVTWNSTPAVPGTTIALKSATGGVSGTQASFSLSGKYKGSFGGSDKGKTSATQARTVESVGTLSGECGGAGISTIHLTGPASGNALTLQ